jgi:hypothetical protein
MNKHRCQANSCTENSVLNQNHDQEHIATDRHCGTRAENVKQVSASYFLRRKTRLHFHCEVFSPLPMRRRRAAIHVRSACWRNARASRVYSVDSVHLLMNCRVLRLLRAVTCVFRCGRAAHHLNRLSSLAYD